MVISLEKHLTLLACVLISLALGACDAAYSTRQPIAYPHKTHVVDQEMACTDCHVGAEAAEHAAIPTKQTCIQCHAEALGESPEEARLVAIVNSEEPLSWHRVTRVAEHVHFSHRRHVVAGGITCETCHGEISSRVEPITRPYIDFRGEIGMQRCINCHRESGNPRASVDCALCHR